MAATSGPPASANGNGSLAGVAAAVGAPTNPMATALLTDQYQFSMAYAYWKAGKHADRAVTLKAHEPRKAGTTHPQLPVDNAFIWDYRALLRGAKPFFLVLIVSLGYFSQFAYDMTHEYYYDVIQKEQGSFYGGKAIIVSFKEYSRKENVMQVALWKVNGRPWFDLYFRKNPFGGEFTVFAGLEECIKFMANFKFTEHDISFLQSVMPTCEGAFFDYLGEVDCSDVEVYSIPEGSVVFPKVPLMRVEGPVAVVQLLETPFVNLINYASLVTTNAARHRHVAGKSKVLLEFGLRRAQGPDGAISASKYCFMGGFDATRWIIFAFIVYN
ncbi:Nicotinate phosphoribosyltransferase 2 [Zea mays]|uniref:nicotinate phosphoribosyltransferase n=1 Tax=Zea mays TaxID=4577 RepID=A0A3L6FQQ4_MAIZE|nr:Nicotinate phosphoribosyltransferase 2 [Zea mays]